MLSHIFVKHVQLSRMDPHGTLNGAEIYQIYTTPSGRGFAPEILARFGRSHLPSGFVAIGHQPHHCVCVVLVGHWSRGHLRSFMAGCKQDSESDSGSCPQMHVVPRHTKTKITLYTYILRIGLFVCEYAHAYLQNHFQI